MPAMDIIKVLSYAIVSPGSCNNSASANFIHFMNDLSQALEELSNGVICMGGEDNVEMGVICVLLTSQSMVPPNLLQSLYIDIEQAGREERLLSYSAGGRGFGG